MDVVLRARHDLLMAEFTCLLTELRVVRSLPGTRFSRTIEAFCTEPRARLYEERLTAFLECCDTCEYYARHGTDDEPLAEGAHEVAT